MTDIRELASKATSGPWEAVPQSQAGPIIARRYDTGKQMNPTGLRLIAHMMQRDSSLDEDKANAAFIAACSPERIIAYEDCVEALRDLRTQVRRFAVKYGEADFETSIASAAIAALDAVEEGTT